mgnify:CR=1 FL=1
MSKIDLYKGDCLEVMDQLIADGVVVDAIITDPPYGTTACKWDTVIPFEDMWNRLNKLIKPNGAIVLFGSEPFSSALRMSNIKNYKYDWTTIKSKPTGHLNAKKQPLRTVESISVFYKTQCNYFPQDLKDCDVMVSRTNRGNYGECSKTTKQTKTGYPKQHIEIKSIDGLHQTQKPVALMEYLIKTYTLENETVLDFTMGSGTTGVACKNLGRDFIGIELDEKYFNIAQNRIKQT